jgi:hypothetical protein
VTLVERVLGPDDARATLGGNAVGWYRPRSRAG